MFLPESTSGFAAKGMVLPPSCVGGTSASNPNARMVPAQMVLKNSTTVPLLAVDPVVSLKQYGLVHVSEDVRVTGNFTCSTTNIKLDMDLLQGWNVITAQPQGAEMVYTSGKVFPGAVLWVTP